MQEITQLHSELAALKSKTVKGLSNVQTTDVTGQAELRGVIANLEAQLDLEHTLCETHMHWYKGALEEISRKQLESNLQCAQMKQRLSEKDAEVCELLKTVSEMSDSMDLLREQIAQVQQSPIKPLESTATFATKIPDAGSTVTAPSFLSSWINVNQSVTPPVSMPTSTDDAQFVVVQVLVFDTLNVLASSIGRDSTTVPVMQGMVGQDVNTFPDPWVQHRLQLDQPFKEQLQHNHRVELLFQRIRI